MASLFNAAECAMPSNPLSQVLKHTEGERSGVQRDIIAGPSSSGFRQFQSGPLITEQDLAMARQFFDGQPNHGQVAMPVNISSQVMAAELAHRMSHKGMPSGQLSDAWNEFQAARLATGTSQSGNQGWSNEFRSTSLLMEAGGSEQPGSRLYSSSAFQHRSMAVPLAMGVGRNMTSGVYNPSLSTIVTPTSIKGKGKEADLEAAFVAVMASLPQKEEILSSRIEEVSHDGVEQLAGRLQEVKVEEPADFQQVWNELQQSDLPPPEEDLAKWEAEFNQLMASQYEEMDYDYGAAMQTAWENGLGDFGDEGETSSSPQFDEEGVPILQSYSFETGNKYMSSDTSGLSSLDQAKTLLAQNGSLSEAALLLEAAIQKGELGNGGYEAWILLGETRTMDEREEAGMRALQEGVKRAEVAGAKGEGMLSLAISFTNESYDRGAHATLARWLQARYPQYPLPVETVASLRESSWHSHERITEAFLTVARAQHTEGTVDPDVQIGLGVLFYNNSDFERAKDCFESALAIRPQDYLLWNRFGSALSNGNRPEEALGAYREALNLRPTYTRAIYNVGVACLNIGAHKEASEHFLSALALQDSTGGEKSEQIWFTLRRALLAMDRFDLAENAKAGTSVDVFRTEGFEF